MTRRALGLVLAASVVAACGGIAGAAWSGEACQAFRRLNEDVQLEDPEDVATANVETAEAVAARLSTARWPAAEPLRTTLLESATAAATAGRAYLSHDFDAWIDGMSTHLTRLDAAEHALRTQGVDCDSPLRYPIASP